MKANPTKMIVFRLASYALLGCMALYSAYSIYKAATNMYWDFPNYYVAAKLLTEGEKPAAFYDNQWYDEKAGEMGIEMTARFSPFPPITSLIMVPLTPFKPITAKLIWVLVNCTVLLLLIRLLLRVFRFDLIFALFLVFALGLALANNFKLGQFYLITVFGLFCAYSACLKGKFNHSGSILAVLTSIKYFPIVFLYGLSSRKSFFSFSCVILVLFLLQWPLFGWSAFEAYIQIFLNHLNGTIAGQGSHPIAFQSFDSFLSNVFVNKESDGVQAIIDWPSGKALGKYLIVAVVLFIAIRAIQKLKSVNATNLRDGKLMIAGMAFLTILPASATYHYVLLLFPFALLLKMTLGKTPAKTTILLMTLYVVVANSSGNTIPWRTGIEMVDLILSYPRLWAMTLLFLVSVRVVTKTEPGSERSSSTLTHHLLFQ